MCQYPQKLVGNVSTTDYDYTVVNTYIYNPIYIRDPDVLGYHHSLCVSTSSLFPFSIFDNRESDDGLII